MKRGVVPLHLTTLSDFDVINLADGQRLGYVSDAVVDTDTGRISEIIVICEQRQSEWHDDARFQKELHIPFDQVTMLGRDVIFVTVEGDHASPR